MDCICSTFSNQWPLKALYNILNIHPFMHTFTHTHKATASSSGAVFAQEHLDTRRGGAGDQLSTFRLPADPVYLRSLPVQINLYA